MKIKPISHRIAELSVLCGMLCTIFISLAGFEEKCDALRNGVLRLHIIANSDSEADQAVKLLVRDRILTEAAIFAEADGLAAAESAASAALPDITAAATAVLTENGFTYGAVAEVGESYFETREYEDFTLPAGNYRSLIIKLGKAEGKNWWCVVFPSVCLPAASKARLSDSVEGKAAEIAETPNKYIMRFKAVELYEDLKERISSKASHGK